MSEFLELSCYTDYLNNKEWVYTMSKSNHDEQGYVSLNLYTESLEDTQKIADVLRPVIQVIKNTISLKDVNFTINFTENEIISKPIFKVKNRKVKINKSKKNDVSFAEVTVEKNSKPGSYKVFQKTVFNDGHEEGLFIKSFDYARSAAKYISKQKSGYYSIIKPDGSNHLFDKIDMWKDMNNTQTTKSKKKGK